MAAADCRLAPKECTAAASDGRQRSARLILHRQPDGTWQYDGWTCVTTGSPQVTAAMVRARAVRLIPTAAIGLAPRQTTLVNIETVMWVDAPNVRRLPTVSILGRSVSITIRLAEVIWHFGDGQTATTGTAGKAYDDDGDPCHVRLCPTYFGHVYPTTGTRSITATASWTATFQVGSAEPVTIPGTVTGPTASAGIDVKQARAVLVPNPGDR